MTSSLRHKTKFWGLFLQKLKVQSNIYQMVGWNKLYLQWFRSNSQLKMSSFGGRERESRERERERERESGTVTFHLRSSGRCVHDGTLKGCCVLLLDDVISWWMFQWRSGALAWAQMFKCSGWKFVGYFCGVLNAIVEWWYELMNVQMKIRDPCQGPDLWITTICLKMGVPETPLTDIGWTPNFGRPWFH